MSGLPQELIFLLIVGLFWLAQFVMQQRRQQAPPDPATEDAAQATPVAEERPGPPPRPPAFVPNLAEGPRPSPPARERHAPAAPMHTGSRRYARSALMGNRRAVQNAVVTATILQPCRAHRPYGTD